MNYRKTEILDEKSVTGTGTEIIPINVKDIISRISFSYRFSKSVDGMSSYPHKDITKIELVDGSDILHGMDGGQNQALCIYDRKVGTMSHGQHMYANDEYSVFGIDFGRFLYDPILALIPDRFNNLALKITYDVDVCDTSNATSYLEVWADVFDEKEVSPIGFLMAKEHYNAVPPASGYRNIDLPTDHPYRKMLVQGYYLAYEPWYVISEARLDEDNGKRIPFDVAMEDYGRMRRGIDPPVIEDFDAHATTGGLDYYTTPTNYWAKPIVGGTTANQDYRQTATGKGGKFTWISDVTTELHGIVMGWQPNHCFLFPFGLQEEIDDWYDVTKLGSLRLRLKVGTYHADERMAVVIQQLRRY